MTQFIRFNVSLINVIKTERLNKKLVLKSIFLRVSNNYKKSTNKKKSLVRVAIEMLGKKDDTL